jgi:hypothetical protein
VPRRDYVGPPRRSLSRSRSSASTSRTRTPGRSPRFAFRPDCEHSHPNVDFHTYVHTWNKRTEGSNQAFPCHELGLLCSRGAWQLQAKT